MGPGRAWKRAGGRNLGLGSRGPAAGGGRSLRVWTRKAAGALAPALLRGKRGKKTSCPRAWMPRAAGANVAVVVGAGSECDHPTPPPPKQPLSAGPELASLSKPPPWSGPGPRPERGGQEEAPEGGTLGAATRWPFGGGARLCVRREARLGFLPHPSSDPAFGDRVSSLNPK